MSNRDLEAFHQRCGGVSGPDPATPAFFGYESQIEADLVDRNALLDLDFTYQDRITPEARDYYHLRIEQMEYE